MKLKTTKRQRLVSAILWVVFMGLFFAPRLFLTKNPSALDHMRYGNDFGGYHNPGSLGDWPD